MAINKPTLKKPTEHGKKLDKSFNREIHSRDVDLNVQEMMDNNLNRDGGGHFDDREYLTHRIEKFYDTMEEPIKKDVNEQEVDETTGAASAGAFTPALGHKKEIDESESIEETTTTTSAGDYAYVGPFGKRKKDHIANKPAWDGGEIIGENYITDPKFFKQIFESYINEGLDSPNNDSRVPIGENANKQSQINYIIQKTRGIGTDQLTSQELSQLPDDVINTMYTELESGVQEGIELDEKAKSQAQQKFMGMVYAHKKGELDNPSKAVEKAADSMSTSDAEDFAATKHKGLPEKVDENPLAGVAARAAGTAIGGAVANKMLGEDEQNPHINKIINIAKDILPKYANDIGKLKDFSDAIVNTFFGGDYLKAFNFLRKIVAPKVQAEASMIDFNDTSMASDSDTSPTSMANTMKTFGESQQDVKITNDNKLNDFGTSDGGIDQNNTVPHSRQLISAHKMDDMANEEHEHGTCEGCGEPLTEDGHCRKDEVPVAGKLPHEKGSCRKKHKTHYTPEEKRDNKHNVEVRIKRDKEKAKKLRPEKTKFEKELDDNKKQLSKLKEMVELSEDRKPSALVQLDRLHKDNDKNFSSDMKDSNTAEIKTMQDEIMAKDQITQVGDNPYELGEKIEKEKLEQNGGDAFENVGNSTNDNNKEIPKRNFTENEQEQLNMDRGLGMQDIVYDNLPDERFEKRMEKDMGEEIYKQRQQKMDYRKDAPMYNKDTEPVTDGIEKDQFDKNKAKYNDKKGFTSESIVTGRYKNYSNRNTFVNFKINEAVETDSIEGKTLLNLEGLGNTYTQNVNENESIVDQISNYQFYFDINENKVYKFAKKKVLNEGEQVKPTSNLNIDKMKNLWGYKPSNYIDTTGVKKNAKF